MAENEIRTVRITPAEDERLLKIVPDFLKGGRKIEQRVRWAIEEVCKRGPCVAPTPAPFGSEASAGQN